jgi:hypothetical protein
MLLGNREIIRTAVEDLFLREMVEEDRSFLYLGECNSSALDTMIETDDSSIFDDVSECGNDCVTEDDDDFYIS